MFDLDLSAPLTEERKNEVIESIAKKIVDRHLQTPAVLFLDMHKPLSYIASQSVLVAMPLLGLLFGPDSIVDMSKFLAERENIEALIARIENMSAARDAVKPADARE